MVRGMVREAATARPVLPRVLVASPAARRRERAVLVRRFAFLPEPEPFSGAGSIQPVAPVIEALTPETAIENRILTNPIRVCGSGVLPSSLRLRGPIVMRPPDSSVALIRSLKKPHSPNRFLHA